LGFFAFITENVKVKPQLKVKQFAQIFGANLAFALLKCFVK
jgi:hypothetical protein